MIVLLKLTLPSFGGYEQQYSTVFVLEQTHPYNALSWPFHAHRKLEGERITT